jgi:hemerythrin
MTSNELQEPLQTGVDEMDREHALELQIVRSIQRALAGGKMEELPQLLEKLEDFTNAHFLAEQLLMRLHAYPGFEAHQQEHDELMEELRELGRQLMADDTTDPVRQAEKLEQWLIRHIQSEDQALAEFLKSGPTES